MQISRSIILKAAAFSAIATIPAVLRVALSTLPFLIGDGPSYLHVAQSLASGHGYTEPHGLWLGAPTFRRLPGWPFVLSVPLWLLPHANPVLVARLTAAAMLGIAGFGTALITWLLSRSVLRMAVAAVLVVLLPDGLQYALAGISEPVSAAIIVVGTLMLCVGWWWGGVVVLSLLPLIRGYFVLLPVCTGAILAFLWFRERSVIPPNWRRLIASTVLFLVPTAVWTARNYFVSGTPTMTAVDGEDLYGTYNPLTVTPGRNFGAFIFPDGIPGQEPFRSLAARMSEIEVSRYYKAKGWGSVRGHWRELPLMALARLVRMMLPPRDSIYHDRYIYVEWFCRSALYLAAAVQLRRRRLTGTFGIMLAASCLVVLSTQLIWVGLDRFLYQVTVLLVPFVCSMVASRPNGQGPSRRSRRN